MKSHDGICTRLLDQGLDRPSKKISAPSIASAADQSPSDTSGGCATKAVMDFTMCIAISG